MKITFLLNEGIERIDKPQFRKYIIDMLQMEDDDPDLEKEIYYNLNYFKQLISNTVIPFSGRYKEIIINWLINVLMNHNLDPEDAGLDSKATEYFQNFIKYSPKFKTQSKDINTYKNLAEIFKAYKPYKDLENQGFKFDPKQVKDSKIIYEDNKCLIMQPLTTQASCELGINTEWCTAKYKANDHRNMFDMYNDNGPMYIYFDKTNGKKIQYHPQSTQMMDEDDAPIVNLNFFRILGRLDLIKFIDMGKGRFLIGIEKWGAVVYDYYNAQGQREYPDLAEDDERY